MSTNVTLGLKAVPEFADFCGQCFYCLEGSDPVICWGLVDVAGVQTVVPIVGQLPSSCVRPPNSGTLTTLPATPITTGSGTMRGEVGGAAVAGALFRFKYSTNPAGPFSTTFNEAGTLGTHTFNLTGLNPSTTIYYYAELVTPGGAVILTGDQLSFTTLANVVPLDPPVLGSAQLIGPLQVEVSVTTCTTGATVTITQNSVPAGGLNDGFTSTAACGIQPGYFEVGAGTNYVYTATQTLNASTSGPSNQVTYNAPVITQLPPPSIAAPTPGDGTLSFPITSCQSGADVTLTLTPGPVVQTVSCGTTNVVFSGLTNGVTYTAVPRQAAAGFTTSNNGAPASGTPNIPPPTCPQTLTPDQAVGYRVTSAERERVLATGLSFTSLTSFNGIGNTTPSGTVETRMSMRLGVPPRIAAGTIESIRVYIPGPPGSLNGWYAAGNGGNWRASVYRDDGTAQHRPNFAAPVARRNNYALGMTNGAWLTNAAQFQTIQFLAADLAKVAVAPGDVLHFFVQDNIGDQANWAGINGRVVTASQGLGDHFTSPIDMGVQLYQGTPGFAAPGTLLEYTLAPFTNGNADGGYKVFPIVEVTMTDGSKWGCTDMETTAYPQRNFTLVAGDQFGDLITLPTAQTFTSVGFRAGSTAAGTINWRVRVVGTNAILASGSSVDTAPTYSTVATFNDSFLADRMPYRVFPANFTIPANTQVRFEREVISGTWKAGAHLTGTSWGSSTPPATGFTQAQANYGGAGWNDCYDGVSRATQSGSNFDFFLLRDCGGTGGSTVGGAGGGGTGPGLGITCLPTTNITANTATINYSVTGPVPSGWSVGAHWSTDQLNWTPLPAQAPIPAAGGTFSFAATGLPAGNVLIYTQGYIYPTATPTSPLAMNSGSCTFNTALGGGGGTGGGGSGLPDGPSAALLTMARTATVMSLGNRNVANYYGNNLNAQNQTGMELKMANYAAFTGDTGCSSNNTPAGNPVSTHFVLWYTIGEYNGNNFYNGVRGSQVPFNTSTNAAVEFDLLCQPKGLRRPNASSSPNQWINLGTVNIEDHDSFYLDPSAGLALAVDKRTHSVTGRKRYRLPGPWQGGPAATNRNPIHGFARWTPNPGCSNQAWGNIQNLINLGDGNSSLYGFTWAIAARLVCWDEGGVVNGSPQYDVTTCWDPYVLGCNPQINGCYPGGVSSRNEPLTPNWLAYPVTAVRNNVGQTFGVIEHKNNANVLTGQPFNTEVISALTYLGWNQSHPPEYL